MLICVICIATAAQNSRKCFQIKLMLNEEVGRLLEKAFCSVEMLQGFSKSQVNDKCSFKMSSCEHASQLVFDYTVFEKQILLLQETVQHHPNFT